MEGEIFGQEDILFDTVGGNEKTIKEYIKIS